MMFKDFSKLPKELVQARYDHILLEAWQNDWKVFSMLRKMFDIVIGERIGS